MSDPDVAGAKGVWTQHTVDGPGTPSVVRWYELVPSLCNGTTCPAAALKQAGTVSDATPLRLQRRDLADRQRPGRGDPLQPRQRIPARSDPRSVACGGHAGGGDRGRHPDRIERGRGAGLQLQPGAVPVGGLRGSDARPDAGRHGVGVEPAARLPEWQQPEVDHPQLRDPGAEWVRAAGRRYSTPGLAGTRLRRVLGGQPYPRTAARLRLMCSPAADLDAAHGRHPRCQRPAAAVAGCAAVGGRARRPCYAGR